MYKLKNKKDRSFAILAAMFIVSVGAVIFYVSYSFDAKDPGVGVKAGAKTADGENLKSDVSGWKVYYSKDYKLRVDYPGDWKVQVTKNEDLSAHSVYFGEPVNGYYPVMMSFDKKPSDISLKDWVENNTNFSATFKKGFIESKGLPSNYYIDLASVDGREAYKVSQLSDTYFFSKVFKGSLDQYYFECKCGYDKEAVYVLDGDVIIGLTAIYDMGGEKTQNKLVESSGRFEVESPDPSYNASKEIFSKISGSFRFVSGGK